MIEFKHKGSLVLGVEIIIKCLGCKKYYAIDASHGIVEEMDLDSAK